MSGQENSRFRGSQPFQDIQEVGGAHGERQEDVAAGLEQHATPRPPKAMQVKVAVKEGTNEY